MTKGTGPRRARTLTIPPSRRQTPTPCWRSRTARPRRYFRRGRLVLARSWPCTHRMGSLPGHFSTTLMTKDTWCGVYWCSHFQSDRSPDEERGGNE